MTRKKFFINNYPFIIFYSIIALVNIGIFMGSFWVELPYRSHVGSTQLAMLNTASFALGRCTLLNFALLPITVCRKILAWIGETPLKVAPPFDNRRSTHWLLGLGSCLVAIAHAATAITFDLLTTRGTNTTLVNALLRMEPEHMGWMNKGMMHITGYSCCLIIVIIVITSLLRHHMPFQVFFLTHQLYLVLYAMLIMHASAIWAYLMVPLGLWVTELLLRQIERPKASTVAEVILLPSNIVVLVLTRPHDLIFKPGDYVYLRIPEIDRFEWLKFTITSAPEQAALLTIHIRITDNWTSQLRNHFLNDVSFHYIPHRLHALESITVIQRACQTWRNMCGGFQNIQVPMGKPPMSRKERLRRNQVDAMAVEEKHLTMNIVLSGDDDSDSPIPERAEGREMLTGLHRRDSVGRLAPGSAAVVGGSAAADGSADDRHTEAGAGQPAYSAYTRNYGKVMRFQCGAMGGAWSRWESQQLRHSITPALEERVPRRPSPIAAPPNNPPAANSRTAAATVGQSSAPTQDTGTTPDTQRQTLTPIEARSSVPKLPGIPRTSSGQLQPGKKPVVSFTSAVLDSGASAASVEPDLDSLAKSLRPRSQRRDDGVEDVYFDRKIEVFMDGPYSFTDEVSTSIFTPQHVVIAVLGRHVEPFASILQSILIRNRSEIVPCPNCACQFKMQLPSSFMNIRKVDFVWVNSDMEGFEWFLELLQDMELYQQQHSLLQNFIEFHLYKTSVKPMPSFMPMRRRLVSGKPVWEELFRTVVESSQGGLEVFFSGPRAARCAVRRVCRAQELPFTAIRF